MWVKSKRTAGFTIVELLIVIVVIGILAAITIVAYSGVQNRANDTAVQSDLANMSKKIQMYYIDNAQYPSSVAELATVGINVSNGAYATSPTVNINLGYCVTANYTGYATFAMAKSGKRYYISEKNGVMIDNAGTTWDNTTGTNGNQCYPLGYSVLFSHGYVSTDSSTGPWRAWAGGN